ncbi:MAG: sulfur carrier protein ThiS [Burkholderiaceae bacterium]|nr:MAG: sulfur carrier protein ThiS [Burkholderiaceae bacterium]
MPADTLRVMLDDQPHQLPPGSTLADFLARLPFEADKVATARNGEFVAREARATTLLQDGDQVLLFQAIVGG